MNLEELEKQVTYLEDILEIENLQKIYGYYFDNHIFKELLGLFSENFESVEITDHGVFRGKDSVARLWGEGMYRKHPGWMFFSIMQSQGVIDIASDGKTATGHWCTPSFESRPFGGTRKQTWLCENKTYGSYPRAQWLHGYYENKYVKENGKWFFSKLHWNNTFCTSVEDDWLNLPVMNLMPIPDADDPPSAFHPYPDNVHNVPYHYKHPITRE